VFERELARRLPHPASVLDAGRRPADAGAVRDRRSRRRRLDRAQAAESSLLDAGACQPDDGALTPHPRRSSQPSRHLELRDMPPNHTLIEIQPGSHSWYRHDAQPPDEPPDPDSSWSHDYLLTHYESHA
jgi:hypothetical protein